MNTIRQTQELNRRELEAGISTQASWHADYHDTAYIYIGGLPFELSEGDIATVFSQYGEPTFINLVRDKETGKSRGYAFLKYEDQRSTDLAVDNLGGSTIMGRMLRVDHTRYKSKDEVASEDHRKSTTIERSGAIESSELWKTQDVRNRQILPEERELALLIQDHDDEDPMKNFLIKEKKLEVTDALKHAQNDSHRGHQRLPTHQHKHQHRYSQEGVDKTKGDRTKRHRRQS